MSTRPDRHFSILVSVATYKRPTLLAGLLNSMAEMVQDGHVEVAVVDNDPDQTAQKVCFDRSEPVTYLVESRPGIAAARNCGLTFALDGLYDYIIFVDDDEEVTKSWLSHLLETAALHDADVVSGPVVSRYPQGMDRWVVAAGFFDRPRRETGSAVDLPATNNTLVRLDSIRAMTLPEFSEEFSLTGGSDNEFFLRLRRSGAKMVWCDEAIVTEMVPLQRISVRWVSRRAIRHGNVLARLYLPERGRLSIIVSGFGRILVGLIRIVGRLVRGRNLRAAELQQILRGVGMVQVSLGSKIIEYQR